MLTTKLMELTIIGGSEWVMVLLLFLSVASISVIVERALFFRKQRNQLDELDTTLSPLIMERKRDAIIAAVSSASHSVFSTATTARASQPIDAVEKILASALGRQRLRLERRLAFLGTLGNNAPFIGLFGTVLGIIRAFHDLSLEQMKGANAVMAGISEALVATAIGLFVAIPAVIAYNYFQRQADRTLSITESLAQGILAVFMDATTHPNQSES